MVIYLEMQTCIWSSWCHCHSLSLASVKSRLVWLFWYRLFWSVLVKRPLNMCVCVCARACVRACSGNSNWARPYVTKWSGRIWHQMALCGSVGKYIVGTTQTIFAKFPVHVTYGRGAVLFWRLAMSYVLQALWMTSYLGIMVRNRRRKKGDSTSDSTGGHMHLTLRHILKLTQQGAECNRGWSLISMIA